MKLVFLIYTIILKKPYFFEEKNHPFEKYAIELTIRIYY